MSSLNDKITDIVTNLHNSQDDITTKQSYALEQFLALIQPEEAKAEGRWKPGDGEYYWFVDIFGKVRQPLESYSEYYQWQYEQGNCFQTEAEAAQYITYLNAKARIKNGNDWKPDWGEPDEPKHYIYYDNEYVKLKPDFNSTHQRNIITYYPTREVTEQAIKDFEEEYLLVFKWERENG